MSNYIDFNNDGISGNIADLVYLTSNLSIISNSYSKQYDVNQDNIIDASDVEYLANHIIGNSGYELPKSGLYVQNKENGNISIGYSNTVNGNNSIIIGNNSTSNYNNSIAIGNNLSINSSNEIILGNDNTNNILIGNVKIVGDLSLNGIMHIVDTNVNTTEMLHIENDGVGPALIVNQTGIQPVLDIQDDGNSCLYIKDGGNVGIGTTDPIDVLDVSGSLNVTGKITGVHMLGSIIMWSGNYINEKNKLNDSGWYLCDGNNDVQINGITIPNLLDKFIRASATIGQIGGSNDSIIVNHTHEMQEGGLHDHTVIIHEDGQHTHGIQQSQGAYHNHGIQGEGTHTHDLAHLYAPIDDRNFTNGSQQIWGLRCDGDGPNTLTQHSELYMDQQARPWYFGHASTHTHTTEQNTGGQHTHGIDNDGTHTHGATIEENGEHNHIINEFGQSGIGANQPSYYTLAFLIYVG